MPASLEPELATLGWYDTGFTGDKSAALRMRLETMALPKRPFAGPTGRDRHATWVRPELVCEVTFNEWPEGGRLRHASFKGLRKDKPPPAVQRERAKKTAPASLLKLTHGGRVIDPSTGLAKMDMVRYYALVAAWALPHLAGRPAYIKRAPLGIAEPMVFQQHPQGLRGLRGTAPGLWPGHDPAIAFQSAEDVVAAAQHGMIELHTWNSTDRAIEQARPAGVRLSRAVLTGQCDSGAAPGGAEEGSVGGLLEEAAAGGGCDSGARLPA